MSYVEGFPKPSRYSSARVWWVIPENLDIKKSQAARRHRSGIPLYVRSRSLDSADGFKRQASTLPPYSRFCGWSIRVHLDMRKGSLIGTETGGSALTVIAFAGEVGGPAGARESFLRRGIELSRTSRSWEVTE